jgi:hypothetical protein
MMNAMITSMTLSQCRPRSVASTLTGLTIRGHVNSIGFLGNSRVTFVSFWKDGTPKVSSWNRPVLPETERTLPDADGRIHDQAPT